MEGERRKLPGHGNSISLRSNGGLADIAPTLLEILQLPKPDAMTGKSLIEPFIPVDNEPMSARMPLSV